MSGQYRVLVDDKCGTHAELALAPRADSDTAFGMLPVVDLAGESSFPMTTLRAWFVGSVRAWSVW